MKKSLTLFVSILLGLGDLVVPVAPALAVGSPTITEYKVSLNATAFGFVNGPDGAVWFTELNGNSIGRITTSGVITEYPVPTENAEPRGITVGPDGAIWFTEQGRSGNIGRITTAGIITEFAIPNPYYSHSPYDIVTGSDGALWFTEFNTGMIGRITTAGVVTEYFIGPVSPTGITAGPDGALWFGVRGGSKIGRMTTSGSYMDFNIPTANAYPTDITVGSDGALWFTELFGNKIGRFTTSGTFTEYSIPTPSSYPEGITAGPDGAVWFTEQGAGKIGQLTTAGVITEYSTPTVNSEPGGITTGSDGALWFGEESDKVGRLVLPSPDFTPPIVAGVPDRVANASGWYDNDVTVAWSSADPEPSSGTPTTPTPTVASLEGTNTYTSSESCDPAGNCATGTVALKIDKTAPVISYSVSPAPNTGGWNATDVVVTFACSDALSGVASCTSPVTVHEGGAQTVVGTAVDVAGNSATASVILNVDKTNPLISYGLSSAANAAGWYNSDVTATFSCSDALSGIASCTQPIVFSNEGVGQTAVGSGLDVAGNSMSTTVSGINIDKTPPVVGALGNLSKNVLDPMSLNISAAEGSLLPGSGVVGGEYFIGEDPGIGQGRPMTYAGGSLALAAGDNALQNLPAGLYQLGVRSVDAAGNWSATSMGQLIVLLPAPTGLSAASPTSNAPMLTWNPVPTATSYDLYRSENGVNTFVKNVASPSASDVYAPGIYNYTVVAINSALVRSVPSAAIQVVVVSPADVHANEISAQVQSQVVPVYGSDILPGLTSAGQTTIGGFDFDLGNMGPANSLQVKKKLTFMYDTGSSHFLVESTNIDWFGALSPTHGIFQGTASVTVGTARPVALPFTVEADTGGKDVGRFSMVIYTDSSRTRALYSVNQVLDKGKIDLK